MTQHTVVAFIEDPGAANALVGLADALASYEIDLRVYAAGQAVAHAEKLGLSCEVISDDLQKIPQPNRPDAVIVGTSENIETPGFAWIADARRLSVPCIGIVDGPANADRRFRGRSSSALTHLPDHIFVADAATRDAFLVLGVSSDLIHMVGHPTTDRTLALADALRREGQSSVRARLFPEIDGNQPLVVFASELSTGLNPAEFQRQETYTLQGRRDTNARSAICLEELIDGLAVVAPNAALVLRLHPKEEAATYAPYHAEIAGFSSDGDAVDAVFAADLVVGMTSVLLYEAALVGRPTISITPRAEETAWLPAIGMGLVHAVHTREDLHAVLTRWHNKTLMIRNPIAEGSIIRQAAATMAEHIAAIIQGETGPA